MISAQMIKLPHTVHRTMRGFGSESFTVSAPMSKTLSKAELTSTSTTLARSDRHGLKYATDTAVRAKRFPITNRLIDECIIGVNTKSTFLSKKANVNDSYPGLNLKTKNEQARIKAALVTRTRLGRITHRRYVHITRKLTGSKQIKLLIQHRVK